MKALKRAVVCMGLLCAALGAALAFLLQYTPQTMVAADETAVETFVEIPLSQLAAVMIENQHTSYAVMQTPSGPEVISQAQAEYDETQLHALLYAATHLSGSRKNTDASTFANYGIDSPRATVTLHLADGSQRVVQVLITNPIDQNVYMYDAQKEAIYLVSASVAELFLRDELELMSHMPLPIREVSDFGSIRSIEMQFGGDTRDYAISCTDTSYFLTAPISAYRAQRSCRSCFYRCYPFIPIHLWLLMRICHNGDLMMQTCGLRCKLTREKRSCGSLMQRMVPA